MLCSLLQDDIEAYRTQNHFLNSEIHQVTKIWRKVAEKERALLMKVSGQPCSGPQHQPPFLTVPSLSYPVSLSPHDLSVLPLDVSFTSCLPDIKDLCSDC